MKQTIEEALLEHEQRMSASLAALERLIRTSILMTKQFIQEEGHNVNANTCTMQPQSRNTEVVTNIQVNLDQSAGGTFQVQLGRWNITGIAVPADGLWDIDNQYIILRPNDLRQVTVTPASGTPKFINFYLQGREVGDFGGTA